MRILRKVRKEFDYTSYVEETFSTKPASNGEMRICCPNCGDNKYKLYVNDEKKHFNCFKCDFNSGNYDVFDFVAISEGIDRGEAILRLTREYAETAPSWESIVDACKSNPVEVEEHHIPAIKTIPHLPSNAKVLTNPEVEEEKPFWDYLLNRGFEPSEVLATQAHYIAAEDVPIFDSHGRRRGNIGRRVIFPVYGGNHDLVSWLSRSTDGREPKYLNAPETEMARTLWPYVPTSKKRAVLVEGLIDSLSVRRLGVATYATFGKKLSSDQISLLKSWGIEEIVLFYDVDAKRDMRNIANQLKVHFKKVFVPDFRDWPKDKDAGDALSKSWNGGELMKNMLDNRLIDVNSMEFAAWTFD